MPSLRGTRSEWRLLYAPGIQSQAEYNFLSLRS